MTLMTTDGYHPRIEHDADLKRFRGEFQRLNGAADFYGKNSAELQAKLKKSLDVYPEICAEKSIVLRGDE